MHKNSVSLHITFCYGYGIIIIMKPCIVVRGAVIQSPQFLLLGKGLASLVFACLKFLERVCERGYWVTIMHVYVVMKIL